MLIVNKTEKHCRKSDESHQTCGKEDNGK